MTDLGRTRSDSGSSSSSGFSSNSSSGSNSNSSNRDARSHSALATEAKETMAHYIFVDIETTGPNLYKNYMPCFAIAVVRVVYNSAGKICKEPKLVHKKKWFVFAPPNTGKGWDQNTLQEFWLKKNKSLYDKIFLKFQQQLACSPQQAMLEFVNTCRQFCNPVLCSDTAAFDFQWIDYYLSHYYPSNGTGITAATLFGTYKAVKDISSYFSGVAGILESRYPHESAMKKHNIDKKEWKDYAKRVNCPKHNHDPENDATHIALRSCWLMWRLSQLKSK